MMVTLTGTFTRLDGTPATGTVRVTPSRSPIMDPDGKIVISGPQTFPLDNDGKLTTEIPASNDPDLGPPFTYTVEALLSHNPWKISKVWIPYGSTTVDLSEIGDYTPTPGVVTRVVTIPADGADGQVLVWDGAGFSWDFPPRGAQGPRGPQGPAIDIDTGLPISVDTTVGTRVFIGGHMVHSDTGWRDMSGILAPGNFDFTNPDTYALARRIGDQIDLQIRANLGSARFGNNRNSRVVVWDPHAGWSPRGPYGMRGTVTVATDSRTPIALGTVGSFTSPARIEMISPTATDTWVSTDIIQINATWATAQPWPTTLPGLPS